MNWKSVIVAYKILLFIKCCIYDIYKPFFGGGGEEKNVAYKLDFTIKGKNIPSSCKPSKNIA